MKRPQWFIHPGAENIWGCLDVLTTPVNNAAVDTRTSLCVGMRSFTLVRTWERNFRVRC